MKTLICLHARFELKKISGRNQAETYQFNMYFKELSGAAVMGFRFNRKSNCVVKQLTKAGA